MQRVRSMSEIAYSIGRKKTNNEELVVNLTSTKTGIYFLCLTKKKKTL